jgi:hypothetical protein
VKHELHSGGFGSAALYRILYRQTTLELAHAERTLSGPAKRVEVDLRRQRYGGREFVSRDEATAAARARARELRDQLAIERDDGTLERERFGREPRDTKG